jgi:late competence protein required for DNA uptake (superfamily II DNA/RNA helicase)
VNDLAPIKCYRCRAVIKEKPIFIKVNGVLKPICRACLHCEKRRELSPKLSPTEFQFFNSKVLYGGGKLKNYDEYSADYQRWMKTGRWA